MSDPDGMRSRIIEDFHLVRDDIPVFDIGSSCGVEDTVKLLSTISLAYIRVLGCSGAECIERDRRLWMNTIMTQFYACGRTDHTAPLFYVVSKSNDNLFKNTRTGDLAAALSTNGIDGGWHAWFSPNALDNSTICRAREIAHEALHRVLDDKPGRVLFMSNESHLTWSDNDEEEETVLRINDRCFKGCDEIPVNRR
jgi:hypothetical protein